MTKTKVEPGAFFDLSHHLLAEIFDNCQLVWQALSSLGDLVQRLTEGRKNVAGHVMNGAYLSDRAIAIAPGAVVEPGAYVLGPAYIGAGAIVRHGALVRENVILLEGSVLGHASEAKNSLFLPGAHAPHFNYIGDSILGHRVNLGAGTKLSNLTLVSQKDLATGRRPSIKLTVEGKTFDSGLTKLGAILGDDVQTGCNAVLNPGCLVGRNTLIYANVSLRKGYYPPNRVVKLRQEIEHEERR